MECLFRTVVIGLTFLTFCESEEFSTVGTSAYRNGPSGATEHPGGIITEGQQRLFKSKSPYWIRSDLTIEKNAELVIEAGVEIRFEPMVGITVKGILTAMVRNTLVLQKFH